MFEMPVSVLCIVQLCSTCVFVFPQVTKKLADMPAVAQSSASVSTVKKTAALWKEAADILQVFESLAARPDSDVALQRRGFDSCIRLGPDVGKFTDGSHRVSSTDMKYWRHRQARS